MKAIQYAEYGPAEVLQIVDLPPPAPRAGELKISVRAVSVNPVDWKIRAGMMAKFMPITLPAGIGRDGSGVVTGLGDGVADFKDGDEVVFMVGRGDSCAAAEIAIRSSLAAAKPARLTFVEAAAFPLVAVTAWISLGTEAAGELAGKEVLIHGGAGGVGGMAVQIARHKGANVAATCSNENADYVRALGAGRVIAYDQEDFAAALTDIDLVYDTIGGDIHKRSYAVLKPGGRMVCINAAPYEDLSKKYGVTTRLVDVSDFEGALPAVTALADQGVLAPQVGRTFAFADAAQAHRLSETGHGRGKLVLTLDA